MIEFCAVAEAEMRQDGPALKDADATIGKPRYLPEWLVRDMVDIARQMARFPPDTVAWLLQAPTVRVNHARNRVACREPH